MVIALAGKGLEPMRRMELMGLMGLMGPMRLMAMPQGGGFHAPLSIGLKLKVDVFIDDRNIGGLPDWGTMYRMIKQRHKWDDVIDEITRNSFENHEAPKKKHWWQF